MLVCGSRSLASDPAAEAWARSEIRRHLLALTPERDAALAGGAEGPDQWLVAEAVSLNRGLFFAEYKADGQKVTWRPSERLGGGYRPTRSRWAESNIDPLERNRAMIAALARRQAEGWLIRVVGFVDKCTLRPGRGGTDFTLRLAMGEGFDVERLVWPRAVTS